MESELREDISRIFEPKFTTKNSGMGLGLGIIKNIIENYKGTITFETEYGKGTRFTVSLQ
jgi:signal transduction histidine kinase